MPHNLEAIDLSHNFLVKILPSSLYRLPRLHRFFLHNNRFSWLDEGVFDKLSSLKLMTLGDNPWACEEEENMMKLLQWAEQTHAAILGCPCFTKPVCGRSHLATLSMNWHSSLFTEPPFWDSERTAIVTSRYRAKSAMFETRIFLDKMNDSMEVFEDTSSSLQTSTTAQPILATKKIQDSRNTGKELEIQGISTLVVLITNYCLNGY